MAKEIIVNHMSQEIRVAILENHVVTEIYHERSKDKSVVGNIFKGKVLKVLPGMESAFVDIGLKKAAFLYVDDVRTDNIIIEDEDRKNDNINSNGKAEFSGNKRRHGRNKKYNIGQLLKEGQEILVQVSKGPIGTKGARITCHISLPGRNLVLMPHVNNVGVSRQILDEKERQRLKYLVGKLKPENKGFIVRTVAAGRSEEEFANDISYLVNIWDEVESEFKTRKAPSVLYEDLNLTFRTIRDVLSQEVKLLMVDNYAEYQKIKKYLESYLPKFASIARLFKRNVNIFDYYGVSSEIDRALSRKVWLKSGGYLIIDQSEALTAIDVNTGRFTGSNDHEETILQINLESAVELVYQLKLRNIGGIIIIDFIDMELQENRYKVYNLLKEELKKDTARSRILAISEIGLVEMTRKRSRENLGRYLCVSCPYCEGRARIKSPTTVTYEIYREIDSMVKQNLISNNIILSVHPDLADFIENEEMDTFRAMEKLLKGTITIRTSEKFHLEQFEIFET